MLQLAEGPGGRVNNQIAGEECRRNRKSAKFFQTPPVVPAHRPITSSHVMLTFGSEIQSELISMSLPFPLHPCSKDDLNVEPQHQNTTSNLGLKMYHALASEVQG